MQLEYISMVGFVFVLIMTATVIFQSCANGLPGWYSGEFAPIGFQDIGVPAIEQGLLSMRLPMGFDHPWIAKVGVHPHHAIARQHHGVCCFMCTIP